jgi:hypothetical protein
MLGSADALAQDAPAADAPAPAAQPSAHRPKPGAAKPAQSARARHAGTAGSVVPGFETLADGTTRLFVELSQPVQYEVKAAGSVFTCVLKGAHVDKRNNYNPLVTVHFNTPVTSARLVPHGKDLWLVASLRAKVAPTVAMDATKEGGAMLRVEFPKGDYAKAPPPPPATKDPASDSLDLSDPTSDSTPSP